MLKTKNQIGLAEAEEISHEFTITFWNEPVGLLITAILTLIVANLFDLESISTSGSAGFLLIFAIVNIANYKLAKHTGLRALMFYHW